MVNFKVRCIDLMGNNSKSYTVGKIYNIENGRITNDKGSELPFYGVRNFREWESFTTSKFELVNDIQPSIHIYPNKTNINETIAALKQGKEIIKAAKSTCNPADEYDFNKGADIAVSRLLGTDEPKPFTNWGLREVKEVKRKAEAGEWVKIIKDDKSDERCYQKGDIGKYIEDGVCIATGGFVTTKGTHLCNKGPETSFLYEKEYIVLENYTPNEAREVRRKAEVGEWVKTKNESLFNMLGQKAYKVEKIGLAGSGRRLLEIKKQNKTFVIYNDECVVLETTPINPDLSHISDVELLDEIAKRMGGNK